MKLDVWQKAMELYKLIWQMAHEVSMDYKLRSQLVDAAQSISSNIAEGYSRRSINEYTQFLYVALASLSETLTRTIGLEVTCQISNSQFQQFDALHFEVENKLLALIRSIEKKKGEGTWIDHISNNSQSRNNE